MSGVWRFAPEANDDELLSSYLVRVAHAHGIGAYSFLSHHLPCTAIWNRDIDRTVLDDTIQQIAELSGNTFDCIKGMTLKLYASWLDPDFRSQEDVVRAISPWINSIGIYHTTRRRFGLQFCPLCLANDSIFRKEWRLSLVTVCARHGCALLDACPRCGAPVVPHRNHVSHLHCHICQQHLANHYSPLLDNVLFEKLRIIQGCCLSKDIQRLGVPSNFSEFVAGSHHLISVLRERASHYHGSNVLARLGNAPIELLRTKTRINASLFLYDLLTEWPNSFRLMAQQIGLNQRHAINRQFPLWVRSELELLPQGAPRSRKVKVDNVAAQLRSVQRQKPKGWRSRRAELLFKMIKKDL